MACGDDGKLSLDSIRDSLIRQEDTIIFNLIERIKFPINPTLYKQQLPPSNISGSFFQYLFQETEALQSKVGRYLSPEENPFFPDNLSDSIIPLTKCIPVLHPAAESVNVNEKILDIYINQMLPLFCTEADDDANFATTAACDIQLLQALSRRIHYGKFVAEVKFRDSTDEYKPFILAQDRDALMKLLTFEAVEEMVKKRVAKKAKVFGQEVTLNDSVEEMKGKIDPLLVSRLYDEWVIDGERGNEYRRQLLPSYKASRRKYWHQLQGAVKSPRSTIERSHRLILDVLQNCNVPVVKIESHEADDVIATLVEQVIQRGHRVVVASPDKDFKQLISDDVQIVMPVPKFNRWSFYTLKHYVAQYNCDPRSDLSLSKVHTG
ncbi:hypothetical protein AABB24_018378 [Solanum stoloniferum]|uniref:chorismate mutase n=1 Tax=Solanum stoloniferum TaxID=62892 RepID=A0ABD2TBD2_9SOLN